jgi:hypothetical protein
MLWRRSSRVAAGVRATLAACWLPGLMLFGLPTGADAGAPARDVTLKGKVVTLAAAIESARLGVHADTEPTASQIVLVESDGTVTPLLSDEASRALFLDKRLRDRPAEVRGKRFVGMPYLQVVTFKIEEDGRLQTPEYFCDICKISVRFPQICPCCQGPMDLRMRPERP